MSANQLSVLMFLEAPDKKALVLLMVKNNIKFNVEFAYTPPIKDGKTWVTWYKADLERESDFMNLGDIAKIPIAKVENG